MPNPLVRLRFKPAENIPADRSAIAQMTYESQASPEVTAHSQGEAADMIELVSPPGDEARPTHLGLTSGAL